MPGPLELAANAMVAACIVLAARNSIHTWWTGIVGCALFAWVFADAKLYSDAVLQAFFIAANIGGWWNWLHGNHGAPLPIRWTPVPRLLAMVAAGLAFGGAWAWVLATYT